MSELRNIYKIISNKKVCPRFYHLKIEAPKLVKNVRPGQFIHIRVRDSVEPFFRRPFCVYRAQDSIDILYEVVGKGTALLSAKKKNDQLDILGPLGNTFSMPPEGVQTVVMIAGGIGVAPFLFLTDQLKTRPVHLILLYGGRTKEHIFSLAPFKKNGCKIYTATDDGSVGVRGRVSELFFHVPKDSRGTWIYTCGPKPMMASAQQFAQEHQINGEASCEEVMACGLGACLGCATKTKEGYKTVCYDGPVFDLNELVF
ncbi:MAG: dihydroorotate dehydrogenase electron transfer subunit [Candidatus Omnitrophica bacterium]|nr:dihydroorotate dehydrogenase electron transfer subunit [Candidatus Omnitrophota bacterium]